MSHMILGDLIFRDFGGLGRPCALNLRALLGFHVIVGDP